jgi:hypothetical protein
MNKNIRIAATVITLFALSACAGQQKKKTPAPSMSWLSGLGKILPKKKPRHPVATPVNWAGTIRMVNKSENFALIETESASPCVVGEKYISVQNGRESGTLVITSLKAHPFIIADIAGGDPSDGDKIYLPRREWSQEPRSAPDLPSAETPPAPLPE